MKHTTQNGDAGKRTPDYAIVPRHVSLDRSLTAADRAVYDTLASHCGGEDKRECWPSTETLVELSDVTAGALSKSIAWLIERGHIVRWKGPRQMPDGRTAIVVNYRLPWTNESEATIKDRAAFFQSRHASRRERTFPRVEISTGGISTGGNTAFPRVETNDFPRVETKKFPHGETHKNRPLEQTNSEQTRYNNTHTAPAAASQTAGSHVVKEFERRKTEPFNGKAPEDTEGSHIKIHLDLAPPEQIYRIKAFRESADGEQRAEAAWREFLTERIKEEPDWAPAYPNTYLGRFRTWLQYKDIRQQRARLERERLEREAPSLVHIIGNMEKLPWTDRLAQFLEENDRLYEWRKWTVKNHDTRLTDLDCQKSWVFWANNRRQWLARREEVEIPF